MHEAPMKQGARIQSPQLVVVEHKERLKRELIQRRIEKNKESVSGAAYSHDDAGAER